MNFIFKNEFTALKTVLLKLGFETENLIFFQSLIKFELLHVILHYSSTPVPPNFIFDVH